MLNLNFNMEMHFSSSQGRRPHFLYSTNQSDNGINPVYLSPFPNTMFEKYHPRGGGVSNMLDIVKIEQLVNDLQPYMSLVNENKIGFNPSSKWERIAKNKMTRSWGRYVYSTNDGKS